MTNLLQENIEKKAHAKIAHLVFANTQMLTSKNQKSYFSPPTIKKS